MKRAFFYLLVLACLFLSVRVFFSAQELWQENPMPWAGSPTMKLRRKRLFNRWMKQPGSVTVAAVEISWCIRPTVRAYDPRADCYDFSPSFESIAPICRRQTWLWAIWKPSWEEETGFSAYPVLTAPTRSLRHCERRDSTCCARPTTTAWIKVNRVSTELLRSWSRRG